jgi:hypothetical protein
MRLFLAFIAGSICALLMRHFGSAAIEPARVKLLEQPRQVTGSVSFTGAMSDGDRALRPPFALILSASTDRAPATLRVLADGRPVCDIAVASAATRFDCAVRDGWDTPGDHSVVLEGPADGWTLEYLEVATHHGRARGFLELFIVPEGSRAYQPIRWPFAIVAGLLFALATLVAPFPMPRWLRITHHVASGTVVALAAVVTVAPRLSDFVVLVSAKSLCLAAALLVAPRLWVLATASSRAIAAQMNPARRALLSCVAVGALVAAAFAALIAQRVEPFNGNYSGMLSISKRFYEANPLFTGRADIRRSLAIEEDAGYDGQFMFYMAFDPLMRRFADDPEQYGRVADAPAYRYGRIGFSWLTHVIAIGHWRAFPTVMIGIIVLSLTLGAAGLARLAQLHGMPATTGLLVLLVPGFWQSVQVVLPEPLAASLLIAGFLAVSRERYVIASVCFAFAILVRETVALVVLCLAFSVWQRGDRALAVRWLAATVLPVACWRLYIGSVLYPVMGTMAFVQNPGDLTVPFKGMVTLISRALSGEYYDGDPGMVRAALYYPFVVTTALLVAARFAWVRRDALACAALGYGFIAVSLNFPAVWIHVGNGQRTTYELFLTLAMLTAISWRGMGPWARGGLFAFWVLVGGFVTYGAYDAGYVMDAIF